MTAVPLRARVDELIRFIQQGRILDAMTEFYHADAAMQENNKPPTRGLAANIEREKLFLGTVREFHGFGATAIGIEGGDGGTGVALLETWMEFTSSTGQRIRGEQVTVQRWRDGRIVHERFYYDTAG